MKENRKLCYPERFSGTTFVRLSFVHVGYIYIYLIYIRMREEIVALVFVSLSVIKGFFSLGFGFEFFMLLIILL
jgi:hypothetical protein